MGTNMDLFHKNPSHQRKLMDQLTGFHEARLAIGTQKFMPVATAVTSEIAKSEIATSSAVRAPAPTPVTRAAAQPKKEAALVRKAAAGNGKRSGPVGRMQAGLATAVAEDKDWQGI
jgi:hypothetical protein